MIKKLLFALAIFLYLVNVAYAADIIEGGSTIKLQPGWNHIGNIFNILETDCELPKYYVLAFEPDKNDYVSLAYPNDFFGEKEYLKGYYVYTDSACSIRYIFTKTKISAKLKQGFNIIAGTNNPVLSSATGQACDYYKELSHWNPQKNYFETINSINKVQLGKAYWIYVWDDNGCTYSGEIPRNIESSQFKDSQLPRLLENTLEEYNPPLKDISSLKTSTLKRTNYDVISYPRFVISKVSPNNDNSHTITYSKVSGDLDKTFFGEIIVEPDKRISNIKFNAQALVLDTTLTERERRPVDLQKNLCKFKETDYMILAKTSPLSANLVAANLLSTGSLRFTEVGQRTKMADCFLNTDTWWKFD
ncbi:hypothetical protein HYX01_03525 [Candidatus Woesearchaeota archaeon]|nr:hypothetical protein [Candidatus Woesearchaeota archaeon]